VDATCNRPRRGLWFDVAVVLAAKAVALTFLYLLCFSSPPLLDVSAHVFSVEDAK